METKSWLRILRAIQEALLIKMKVTNYQSLVSPWMWKPWPVAGSLGWKGEDKGAFLGCGVRALLHSWKSSNNEPVYIYITATTQREQSNLHTCDIHYFSGLLRDDWFKEISIRLSKVIHGVQPRVHPPILSLAVAQWRNMRDTCQLKDYTFTFYFLVKYKKYSYKIEEKNFN